MKYIIAAALAAALLGMALAGCGAPEDEAPPPYTGGILYSWSMSALQGEGKEKLFHWAQQLSISTLYQDFDSPFLKAGDDTLLAELAATGVEVLHLAGTPEWIRSPDRMISEIDQVLHFNSVAQTPLAGIVFDVEPHAAKNYEEPDDYLLYVQTLRQVYAHAQENGLYMVVVIPYWLERVDDTLLPEMIGQYSDEVSVMNYYTGKTTKHLAEEVQLAQQYGKPINTIYELGFDDDTFGSLEEIHQDFEEICDTYQYSRLRIAYHHLGDLAGAPPG